MAEARITFHPERRGAGTVLTTETHWGYIVRKAHVTSGGAALSEAAMRFLGLVLLVSACVQWLVPLVFYPGGDDMARLGLSAGLVVAGAGLYLFAARGFAMEVQVDTARREFRLARRTARGPTRVLRRVPFETVDGVSVRRNDEAPSELLLGLPGNAEEVPVVSGAERDLNLLHARLVRDIKSPSERVEARLRVIEPRMVAVKARPLRSA